MPFVDAIHPKLDIIVRGFPISFYQEIDFFAFNPHPWSWHLAILQNTRCLSHHGQKAAFGRLVTGVF